MTLPEKSETGKPVQETAGSLRVGNIILPAPQIRAALDGRLSQVRVLAWKTQPKRTGNIVKDWTEKPTHWLKMHRRFEEAGEGYREMVYVKETFWLHKSYDSRPPSRCPVDGPVWYETSEGVVMSSFTGRQRNRRFIPRWASRLTLEVTGTKLERLHEISEEDAEVEGFTSGRLDDGFGPRPFGDTGCTIESPGTLCSAAGMAQIYYHEQYPDPSWDAFSSPECIALIFKVHRCNVEEVKLKEELGS